MQCEQIKDILESYAVGALDDDGHAAVEAHLADCAACRRLANELEETVSALPQALAAVSPLRLPATAKDRLLRALEQELPAQAPLTNGEHVSTHPTPERIVSPGHPRAVRWLAWLRPRTLGTLAAAVIAVLALAWSVQLSFALARERALRAEFDQLLSGQQALVVDVIDSPKTVKAALRATQPGSKAYGKLFTRPDMPNVVVMAGRLPEPPAGQSYHVWLVSGTITQFAGELALNQGFGALIFDAGQDGPVYDSVQVTLQAKGSSAPTGAAIIQWRASQ